MRKTELIKALKELRIEFKDSNRGAGEILSIISLIEKDYILNDSDIYVVNVSSYSKSAINGWTSETESSVYYKFYVEFQKNINNKVVSEWVNIEHHDVDLLMKLYSVLN